MYWYKFQPGTDFLTVKLLQSYCDKEKKELAYFSWNAAHLGSLLILTLLLM